MRIILSVKQSVNVKLLCLLDPQRKCFLSIKSLWEFTASEINMSMNFIFCDI